jgi:hypothetical protein
VAIVSPFYCCRPLGHFGLVVTGDVSSIVSASPASGAPGKTAGPLANLFHVQKIKFTL